MAEKGATPAAAPTATGAEEETGGCWQQKAAYDQCFDQWYKDVFLQHKADGRVGCQDEYKAYSQCFLRELGQDAPLVEGIKSAMTPEIRKRWDEREQQQQQQQKQQREG